MAVKNMYKNLKRKEIRIISNLFSYFFIYFSKWCSLLKKAPNKNGVIKAARKAITRIEI
jgi:hypothetical protein